MCSAAVTRTCRTSARSPRPSAPGLRHQRLRRDAPRAVGVGRQAARGEHADRRARQRLRVKDQRARSCSRRSAPTATAMRDFAGHEQPRVWYPHLDFETRARRSSRRSSRRRAVKRAEKNIAKARTRDSMSAFTKLTEVVDGELRIVDQSPLIVPIEELAAGEDPDALFDELRELIRVYRESLEFDRRALLESSELRRLRAQGRRRGQRRHARVDRADDGARRRAIRCSCRSRRQRPRCWRRSWARASSRTTASESSPGSG